MFYPDSLHLNVRDSLHVSTALNDILQLLNSLYIGMLDIALGMLSVTALSSDKLSRIVDVDVNSLSLVS